MKKAYILALLLLFSSLIIGCSNSNNESAQNEQGNTTKIENLDTPALVFFFTGVG